MPLLKVSNVPRRYLVLLFLSFIGISTWTYWIKTRVLPQDAIPHAPWKYKAKPQPGPAVKENFEAPLPLVPLGSHPPENTPLLIGFTRNWLMLQQTVVSYIAAGWPANDIYVVENTGVMKSNELGKLTLQNPFYLDHKRLSDLGVNIIRTPTLLSFSQLQNFFLYTAIEKDWKTYFWSHQDVVIWGSNFYKHVIDAWKRENLVDSWAALFYAFDSLTLVKTSAYESVGGWDTFIGYYNSDCDMYERLKMAGFEIRNVDAGPIWDVAESIPDLHSFFDGSNLRPKLDDLQAKKMNNKIGRNTWQEKQSGGQGEPYYRNISTALKRVMKDGQFIYALKWGHKWCNLREVGLRSEDAWQVEPDWTFFYDENCW